MLDGKAHKYKYEIVCVCLLHSEMSIVDKPNSKFHPESGGLKV